MGPRAGALAALGLLWLCCCGADDSAEDGACKVGGGEDCGRTGAPAEAVPRRHFWPNKGGNLNASGASEFAPSRSLGQPTWTYRPSAVVHTSPVIDDESNVYVTDTAGRVISLTKDGLVRWSFQAHGRNAGIPALHGDALYCFTDKGLAFSLKLENGEVRWSRQVAASAPADSASAVVTGDIVLMPVSLTLPDPGGNCEILALNLEDGGKRWSYSICEKAQTKSMNVLPSVVSGMVIVHDANGGMHAFSVKDGSPKWYHPGPARDTFTTGASATGPADLAYCGFNYQGHCDDGKGMVRAHDIFTGEVAWTRTFVRGVNAGVAVGQLGPKGRLAVVAMVSDNFMPELQWWEGAALQSSWVPLSWKIWLVDRHTFKGTVVALDAHTGVTIWMLELGEKIGWGYAGVERGCLPDSFSTPSIGADGTVYVNWSAGDAMALYDANGDGRIDIDDPREVSRYHHGFGTNGQTAIAPGLLVAPSCDGIFGWRD